jgi:hypothetical protein
MKLVYHTIFILTVSLGLPRILIARDKEILDRSKDHLTSQYDPTQFVDSIPRRRGGHDQDNGSKDRRPQDGRADLSGARQKPTIKEVPRSIPKLKPKTVTDRIPIKRPPFKIPKKGIRHLRF